MWRYTPRRLAGWLNFARARVKREHAAALAIAAQGARGEPRQVKKQIEELSKE